MVRTEPDMLWEMERRYRRQYNDNPTLNHLTQVRKKDSRLAGILGEIIFERLYPTSIPSTDLRWDYWYKGKRIDIKCKLRRVPGNIMQEASIYEYQFKNSKGEVYYFMSTMPTFQKVWLCGWIGKQEMINHPEAKHWKRNDKDYSNGKQFSADTLNLGYAYLRKPHFDQS